MSLMLRRVWLRSSWRAWSGWLACIAAALLLAVSGQAQTLARPGWTGSGMTTEPWWRSAIFYRIAPEHFQDSDGDGVGDLRGIALRLDYLQALGVDAVVLQQPFDDTGFDDLLEEASRRHIRLVIGLDRSAVLAAGVESKGEVGKNKDKEGKPGAALAAEASHWLVRGAAGILLPPPPGRPEAPDPAEQMRRDIAEQLLLLTLRRAAAQLPGERVVIPEAAPVARRSSDPNLAGSASLRQGPRALRPDNPQLILSTLPLRAVGGHKLSASQVVAALTIAMPGDGAPLLQLQPPETGLDGADTSSALSDSDAALAAVAAAALLTQRSAVLLEFGQELGLSAPDRMAWTPSNATPPEPAAPAAKPPMSAAGPTVFGPYRPYVPPPPRPNPKPTAAATPTEAALPDPGALPGFSTKAVPEEESSSASNGTAGAPAAGTPVAATHGVRSVVLQERDPRSLLNLYRRLAALHHGNATMRSGSLTVLHAGDDAVVWLRRVPAGARTVAPVIVAANCSDHSVTLSLERELAQLAQFALRGGELRALLPGTAGAGMMSVHSVTLAPHGIFVGEIVAGH